MAAAQASREPRKGRLAMPAPDTPADKPNPTNTPDKTKRPPSPRRRKNRFNEREVARAGRAAKAIGAYGVDIDPATGKLSIVIAKPGEADAADSNPWDEVLTNAADEKRPA